MMQIQFEVSDQGVPKGRPRFRIMPAKGGSDALVVLAGAILRGRHSVLSAVQLLKAHIAKYQGFVSTYTPSETVAYEERVSAYARMAMRRENLQPSDRAVELRIELHMKIPVSWSKKKQAAAIAGTVRPTKKPDSGNIQKAIEDAMNGIVYVDDAQIVTTIVWKKYSAEPRVVVAVRDLEGEPA